MSDWINRLHLNDDDDSKNEEVDSITLPTTSDLKRIKPKKFTVVLDYGVVKFEHAYETDDKIVYLARCYENGELCRVDVVEIYNNVEHVRSINRALNPPLIDPVIVYADYFFCPIMRHAKISVWTMEALTKYCGFRFF